MRPNEVNIDLYRVPSFLKIELRCSYMICRTSLCLHSEKNCLLISPIVSEIRTIM